MTNLAMTIPEAAKSLVIRAREGDQNAMGMISAVQDSAKKGSARAKQTVIAIQDYISKNPVLPRAATMGAETVENLTKLKKNGPIVGMPSLIKLPKGGDIAIMVGCVILANGPPLDAKRISDIGATMPEEVKELFYFGVKNCNCNVKKYAETITKLGKMILYAGFCVGLAHNLQKVRQKGNPISDFSPMAGWELGE